ncbi:MAG: trypsin-like peptidase domain-containing protein [Planctomycetota bacterium]
MERTETPARGMELFGRRALALAGAAFAVGASCASRAGSIDAAPWPAIHRRVDSAMGTRAPGARGSISEVFKRVKDSVVVIETTERDAPFGPGAAPARFGGLGSGVLVDASGLVLTAAHVVQVAETIEVSFPSGEVLSAAVVGSVPAVELALLRLERAPAEGVAATLGDSDAVEVGDQILVVGAPHGITHTLSVGHVSARRASESVIGGFFDAEILQTDAAINPGNSGGPMFDMHGRVVGIVSHIVSETGGYEGLGFVMTSNTARELLLEQRSAWTGVEAQLVDGALARALHLPQDQGILVQRVADGSPAAAMGLRPGRLYAEIEGVPILLGGDVLLGVEGVRFSEPMARLRIQTLLLGLEPGDEVHVTVLRDGRVRELRTEIPRPR